MKFVQRRLRVAWPFGLALLAACQSMPSHTDPAAARPVVGESEPPRRILRWRLVERDFEEGDPTRGVVGDGVIAPGKKTVVFEPVYDKPRDRSPEGDLFCLRSGCGHEISATVRGGQSRAVGETATAECRVNTPPGICHEIAVGPTSGSVEVLQVRGAARASRTAGRYLVAGNALFEVVFTSRAAGRNGISIEILREVGEDPPAGSGHTLFRNP